MDARTLLEQWYSTNETVSIRVTGKNEVKIIELDVSDTKEMLLDKLRTIRDLEAAKPIHEMDLSLINACTEYILELKGEESQ